MNFVSNAIVCLFDFFSLDLCLHFLVLFLFCHPYLISSLFWNCLLETNGLSNYIGWITCLSKHLDKLEKKNLLQKKRIMILSAHICMSPYVYFQTHSSFLYNAGQINGKREFLCDSRLLRNLFRMKKFCYTIFSLLQMRQVTKKTNNIYLGIWKIWQQNIKKVKYCNKNKLLPSVERLILFVGVDTKSLKLMSSFSHPHFSHLTKKCW